jgi:hypothetical protein
MKSYIFSLLLATCLFSCKKNKCENERCDIQAAYAHNATKATITQGVWGTVSMMEGNCMPVVDPNNTTCKHCPVKRSVKIYEYTLQSQATPVTNNSIFYTSFQTNLITEVMADEEGFFQATLPAGRYSIAIVEDGKLYVNTTDGLSGLNPVEIQNGPVKHNVSMTYKAVF